jgi:hypothetical protein
MPMLKWLVGCLGVSILVVHFADVEQRSAELQRFLIDKNDGASQIILRYGMTNEQCPQILAGDVYRLALAFVTVESFATPYVESGWWWRGLIWLASRFPISLLDPVGSDWPRRVQP